MGNGPNRTFDLLSLSSFVVLGLPDGMLGTAWPAMRSSFGAQVGDLGWVLLATTAGTVAVATLVGSLIRRLGVPALLAVATGVAAVGGTAYAVAPGLWLVLGLGPLMGAAAGMMDGGLNTAVALTGRRRLLNLLHGFYGIGTAAGPLLVIAAITAGSWRLAYLVLVAVDVTSALVWTAHARRFHASGAEPTPSRSTEGSDGAGPTRGWSRRRVVAVLSLGLIVFFVYTGLEVAAGQWLASFASGHLDLSHSAAGLAAFGYWGALTAVRIGLSIPSRPILPTRVIRWGGFGSLVAAGVIWWQPDPTVAIFGFVAMGATLAGVFPALVSVTALRIGERRARHAIAWQTGAAAAGGSTIAALLGVLINTTSLAVLGPALTVLAVFLIVTISALGRLAPIHRRA